MGCCKFWYRCCRIKFFYVWISLVALVSMVVVAVALASSTWLEGRFGEQESLKMGLLLFCHQNDSQPAVGGCAPILLGSGQGWSDATRLLAVLAEALLLTVVVLGVLLHFLDDDLFYTLPLVVVGLLAATLGMVAAIVFAVQWSATETVLQKFTAHFSWAYGLFVAGHGITLMLFIGLCVLGKDFWAFQQKRKIKRSK